MNRCLPARDESLIAVGQGRNLEFFAWTYGSCIDGRTGNGIRKNALLREILEDRFEMTMRVPRHTEEAAFGAALMGAVSNGVFDDVKETGDVVKYSR